MQKKQRFGHLVDLTLPERLAVMLEAILSSVSDLSLLQVWLAMAIIEFNQLAKSNDQTSTVKRR